VWASQSSCLRGSKRDGRTRRQDTQQPQTDTAWQQNRMSGTGERTEQLSGTGGVREERGVQADPTSALLASLFAAAAPVSSPWW
jgi:hypothetical protein